MHVDSAVELGRDDPALEMPWTSEDGSLRYCDIRNNPALIDTLPEAERWPEMREFLIRANVAGFPLQTAKSDVWATTELTAEEEIFSAGWKFASYVDLLFADDAPRFSLSAHQTLMSKLCTLLQRAPDISASIEFVLRHCYYHTLHEALTVIVKSDLDDSTNDPATVRDSRTGFCLTCYASGFGDSQKEARQNWSIALKLLQHALVQALRS